MDTQDSAQKQAKRKLVNNDDPSQEIQDTKRLRLEFNKDQKRKSVKALSAMFVFIVTKYRLSLYCLHTSAQISNAIRTCFNTKRQEVNGTGHLKDHQDKPITLNIKGVKREIPRVELIKDIVEVLKWFGLEMIKPKNDEKNHWWGTFMPYLTYTCCWQLRMKELRLGHGVITLKKQKVGEEIVAKVKDFGLKPRHHVLLEGVTFPPEIRATIAQSVGPMTTLITHTKESKDSRYGKKHRDAAARAFAHVPGVEIIVKAVEGTKASESAPLIEALGDLSLLVPARTRRGAYFPLAMFAFAALSTEEAAFYAVEYKQKTDDIARQSTARYDLLDKEIKDLKMTDVATPTHHIKFWDVSGKGAIIIYNNVASCKEWTMPKTPEFDVGMMSQAVFHSI